MTTKYPILDETGKVAKWLADGRGITIWQSQDIGANRPDTITPAGAPCPHWAYKADLTYHQAEDVTFYHPVGVVQSWHDTPQGNRAAQRALETNYPDRERIAPAGTFRNTYTIVHYTMGSITVRPKADGGTVVRYRTVGEESPTLLDVEFRVGLLEWSAQVGETT